MRSIKSKPPHAAQASMTDKEKLDKYVNMSEDALMSELMRSVEQAKKSGNFDPKQMQAFIELMSPKLNAEQRSRLKSLVEMISEP